jgi:hypothetical protein
MEDAESIIKELESSTGKKLPQWFEFLANSGKVKMSELTRWLQDAHNLEYKTARKVTDLYLKDREENAARVGYTSSGRSGKVHYISKEATFDLDYEFGGGSAVAIIDIPTAKQWEAATKTPLSRRDAILKFIGQQVVKDQTLEEGSFEIGENAITIYRKSGRK